MLTPADLQLPEKFNSWRPKQLETIARVTSSPQYAFLLDAPTGVGKSLVAAGVQRLLNKNVVYLCTTKQLQDQLMRDFPYAETLKGRNNYPCLKYLNMFPRISAEECTHSKTNECAARNSCPYIIAKRRALRAPLAVLNTSYFLHEVNHVGAFSGSKFLVIDEFDMVESQLMNYIELVLTQRQLTSINIDPPKYKTKFESWVSWADEALRKLAPEVDRLSQLVQTSDDWGGIDIKDVKRFNSLTRLLSKLKFFVREVNRYWVWYPGEDRWVFKPVWVSRYAEGVLWKHAERILGMSATILDPRQVSANTGLTLGGTRKTEYLALDSPFPKENRPVYYEPYANVVNKNMGNALPKLTKGIAGILQKHPNDKVLLHTVSYRVRDYLMKNLPAGRLVTHDITTRAITLEAFKKSDKPLVFVSPSMDRGVDLPQDECRVVIIAKVPYPDLGDPQVSSRVHASADGDNWYAHKTISSIVQMAGRGVRSEDDYAITYILDEQFRKLYAQRGHMFPKWFREAVIM